MARALIAALLINHDTDELTRDLKNLVKARDIALHLGHGLATSYDLTAGDDLELTVESEEGQMLTFAERCREERVLVKAVREDDETHFRLV